MSVVLREADRIGQLVRQLVDRDVDAEFGEIGHHSAVETRDRLSGQGELTRCAVAGRHPQLMIDEVEVDLEGSGTVRYRRSGQAARGDIQRNVPGMVQPWCACQTNLA